MSRLKLFYIVGLHVLLVALIFQLFDLPARWSAGGATERPPHFDALVTFHERVLGNAEDGFIAVLGDSHVQGLAVHRLHPRAVNLGIGRDTTAGVIQRLPRYGPLSRAAAMVLAIGLNDLEFLNEQETAAGVADILRALPAGLPVVCSAVLPVAADAPGRENYAARITELNRRIQAVCAADSRCRFVDAGPRLVDESAALAPEYHVGDGVHLSPRGAELWIELLREGLGSTLEAQP